MGGTANTAAPVTHVVIFNLDGLHSAPDQLLAHPTKASGHDIAPVIKTDSNGSISSGLSFAQFNHIPVLERLRQLTLQFITIQQQHTFPYQRHNAQQVQYISFHGYGMHLVPELKLLLEGHTPPEIAKLMYRSLASVRGFIRRGLEAMRGKIGAEANWFSDAKSEAYLDRLLDDEEDAGHASDE